MKYGPNSNLVEELIEFVKRGPILSGQGGSGAGKWDVITDFDEARRNAWETVIGDDELLWTDVREKEMAKVHGRSYEIENFSSYDDHLSSLLNTFTLYLKRNIPSDFRDVLDDAIGDLYNCAFNRCVFGETDNFFETIFEAYKLGYWPCGWDGNYPDGRLRVFLPVRSTEAA